MTKYLHDIYSMSNDKGVDWKWLRYILHQVVHHVEKRKHG